MLTLQECSRCGHQFYAEGFAESCRCPHCHALHGDAAAAWNWKRNLFWLLVVVAVFAYAVAVAPPEWRFVPIDDGDKPFRTSQAGQPIR